VPESTANVSHVSCLSSRSCSKLSMQTRVHAHSLRDRRMHGATVRRHHCIRRSTFERAIKKVSASLPFSPSLCVCDLVPSLPSSPPIRSPSLPHPFEIYFIDGEHWQALAVTLTTADLFIDGERWRALAVTLTTAELTSACQQAASTGQHWSALAKGSELVRRWPADGHYLQASASAGQSLASAGRFLLRK